MSRHNNVGQRYLINPLKIWQSPSMGMTVTNQTRIQEQIKGGLNSGDGCDHPV